MRGRSHRPRSRVTAGSSANVTSEEVHEADDFLRPRRELRGPHRGVGRWWRDLGLGALARDVVIRSVEFDFEVPREAELKGIEGPQLLYPLTR